MTIPAAAIVQLIPVTVVARNAGDVSVAAFARMRAFALCPHSGEFGYARNRGQTRSAGSLDLRPLRA